MSDTSPWLMSQETLEQVVHRDEQRAGRTAWVLGAVFAAAAAGPTVVSSG
ncbi:hypothetical protein AB0J83_12390 [Actinoplanes sp. NPDC049596]